MSTDLKLEHINFIILEKAEDFPKTFLKLVQETGLIVLRTMVISSSSILSPTIMI